VTSDLPPVMTLKEVLPFVRRTAGSAYQMLQEQRFPIRHIGVRPYLFARADVLAYAERGVKTNPLLAPSHRRFFQAAQRARRAKELAS
jgi:hypothetical protein